MQLSRMAAAKSLAVTLMVGGVVLTPALPANAAALQPVRSSPVAPADMYCGPADGCPCPVTKPYCY